LRKKTQSTGTRKSDAIRVPSIANIFVNASGVKSFPSCPVRAKIGTKERIIISIANMSGHATSLVDSVIITVLCFIVRFCFQSNLLYAFSVTTIAASTIVPIAMAIQPSDIIFEGISKSFMQANVINTHTTRAITVTRDAQKFHKNRNSIIAVIIISAVRIDDKVVIASLIRLVLS
jgi:hypothetical protein